MRFDGFSLIDLPHSYLLNDFHAVLHLPYTVATNYRVSFWILKDKVSEPASCQLIGFNFFKSGHRNWNCHGSGFSTPFKLIVTSEVAEVGVLDAIGLGFVELETCINTHLIV